MYSDLYEVLGNPSAAPTATAEEEKHIAVSFSAGKMELLKKEVSQLWKEHFWNGILNSHLDHYCHCHCHC
jgi:hypothetical protein